MSEYNLSDMLKRIKELKKEEKINNKILSDISGISLGTLSKILAGVTKEPSVESVIKIAHALGVTADYLIFGEESTITPTEQELLSAYRLHPEMQQAINKMLDINGNAPSISDDITNTLKQDIKAHTKQKSNL